ncbi:MAG: dockerin type I domain-containing protein [Bacteroidaceae bacterium]|nr:dockerin type I domain-containing protein [Bacteroidaceae bacterium]
MKKGLLIGAFALSSMAALAQDVVVPSVVGAAQDNAWVVNVALTNTTQFIAFSMDVKLPSGVKVTADKCRVTPRLESTKTVSIKNESNVSTTYPATYKLEYNLSGTTLHIVGYSLGNEPIVGKSGDVLYQITLAASSNINASSFETYKVENVKFVQQSDLTAKSLADASLKWYQRGDVDLNGKVETADALRLLNMANGSTTSSVYADVDNNGKVETADALRTLNIAAGTSK